ncbi:MAG: ATP-binding protein [Methanobacteriaceae archaeon]|nr:ATP-binding protein [Methanobacteriaceae archaeon]
MKCYITYSNIGYFLLDSDYILLDYELFSKNNIIDCISKINENIISNEEERILNRNSKKYSELYIETNNHNSIYESLKNHDKFIIQKVNDGGKYLRKNYSDIVNQVIDETGFEYIKDINNLLNNVFIEVAEEKIVKSSKSDDLMIIETIKSLEEIDDATGKLVERLREWYTPYFPELNKLHNHELYTTIVSDYSSYEEIVESNILTSTHIKVNGKPGVNFSLSDRLVIQGFAQSIKALQKSKQDLNEFIDVKIKEIAPNLYNIAGANLAAKLISHTRSLHDLAFLPASVIQVIGAEKAMFRHLKTGDNPPKHGLIYQHPYVRGSNWWVRGKISRAVATKISIAARIDYFSGDFNEDLKINLDKQVEDIKKRYPFESRSKKNTNKYKSDKKKSKKVKKQKGKKKNRTKKKLKKGEYFY